MEQFPNYGAYEDFDDGYPPRRPRRPRMSTQFNEGFLDPDFMGGGTRLHRSRSTGQRPTPNIYIQNGLYQDNFQRTESPAPPRRGYPQDQNVYYNYQPPIAVPAPQPQVPVVVMPPRSRSRTPSPRWDYQRDYQHHAAELAKLEELKRREQDDKAREELKNAIAKHQRKVDEAEAEIKRKIAEHDAEEEEKKKKEEEERKETIRKAKADEEEKKKKAKAQEEEIIRKYKQDEVEKKEKAKKEEAEFERKRKEKIEKEEAEQKKKDEEYYERMRKDLTRSGLRGTQIERVIERSEIKKSDGKSIALFQRPTFPKVHRKHVDKETLRYYDLPWEYDRLDGEYIIILQEMTERETDVLFEHTRRLRSRAVLTIEERGRGQKPEYAWVRKRSKSRGKSSTREKFAGLFIS